jgi:putative transposase
LISKTRNRTSFEEDIAYGLYFLGRSFRNTSKALSSRIIKGVMLQYGNGSKDTDRPKRIIYKRRKISKFIIDEIQIRVGNKYFWIWIAIEPKERLILDIYLSSAERNMFVAQNFIRNLVNKYGKHPVSTDGMVLGIRMLVNSSN